MNSKHTSKAFSAAFKSQKCKKVLEANLAKLSKEEAEKAAYQSWKTMVKSA
jgi:hypothetical protein